MALGVVGVIMVWSWGTRHRAGAGAPDDMVHQRMAGETDHPRGRGSFLMIRSQADRADQYATCTSQSTLMIRRLVHADLPDVSAGLR